MEEKSAAERVAEARKTLGWSQAKLAEALGFSTVLISKIEAGVRAPSEAFIEAMASHAPRDAEAIREAAHSEAQPDGRKGASLKIVDAIKLAKANGDRANRLKSRAQQIQNEADGVARQLDEKRRELDLEVVDPFSQLASRMKNLPEDVIVHADIQASSGDVQFAETLKEAQLKTGKSIFSLVGAGVLGGGAGAAVGAGAATATYLTVAGIATASTGAAISGLSGAAATSATLAAIGGGSLAAGGLGIAGGTAVLTGIVALPVLVAATGAVLASGGRILDKQKAVEQELQKAENDFEANEAIVRKFIARAGRINEILTVALLAVRNHRRTLERAMPDERKVEWSELDTAAQTSFRRMAEITLACLTVLALPIGLNLKKAAPADVVLADGNLDTVPQIAPELDALPDRENDFIDYAIEESFGQIAR
jgi:transcriptional regulator with XRE-family HTH domain